MIILKDWLKLVIIKYGNDYIYVSYRGSASQAREGNWKLSVEPGPMDCIKVEYVDATAR